jgi:hypothetical protein
LIQLLCQKTKRQLEAADMAYRSLPDNKKRRSLSEKLDAEIGGNYGNFMQYLAMARPVFNGEPAFSFSAFSFLNNSDHAPQGDGWYRLHN